MHYVYYYIIFICLSLFIYPVRISNNIRGGFNQMLAFLRYMAGILWDRDSLCLLQGHILGVPPGPSLRVASPW